MIDPVAHSSPSRLAIIGGGSWGTALSIVLAPRFEEVHLWVYEADLAARMAVSKENDVFLPGLRLPDNVATTSDSAAAVRNCGLVLTVMPSHNVRQVVTSLRPHLRNGVALISATKGIENGTLLRMSQVIEEVLGPEFGPAIAVLSGPTFAREVAAGEPAAVVISSINKQLADELQVALSGPTFRAYTNSDPVGVELGASLKNVIAIAAGICQGLGLGSNSRAALITRGLAEINRLAVAMGGKPSTLAGLAGLGDLVLTCTGDLSRNRKLGIELASGKPLEEILSGMRMVAEGVPTTHAAMDLARKYSVNLPITEQMESILLGRKSPHAALQELMERSLKGE